MRRLFRQMLELQRILLRSPVGRAFIEGMTQEDRDMLAAAGPVERNRSYGKPGRWMAGDARVRSFPTVAGKTLPSTPAVTSDGGLKMKRVQDSAGRMDQGFGFVPREGYLSAVPEGYAKRQTP